MAYRPWNNGQYDTGSPDMPGDPGVEYAGNYVYSQNINIHAILRSLMDHLREYDTRRVRLEREGGRVSDLRIISNLLNSSVPVNSRFGIRKVTLTNPGSLRNVVRDIDFDLHMDVRQRHNQMPVYYLCRVRRDYWGEYSLVVEDLYMSPGYPLTDRRFVKLMETGHEVYYLRLSQFRERAADMARENGSAPKWKVDDILYDLGRHVFQAAWHEDQRLAVMAATQLGLPRFHHAIELLYLCLSGELCELRNAVNESMFRFFEEIYPQPAIRAFLEVLSDLDGGMLNDLPQRAGNLYGRLSRAFSRFIGTEVIWGHRNLQIPLWKILYGNFSRFDLAEKRLMGDKELVAAALRLETESQAVINQMLKQSPAKRSQFIFLQ
jgi:hypothetical protein